MYKQEANREYLYIAISVIGGLKYDNLLHLNHPTSAIKDERIRLDSL